MTQGTRPVNAGGEQSRTSREVKALRGGARWRDARAAAIARDGDRCRALREDGRVCGARQGDSDDEGLPIFLAVHHIEPLRNGGSPYGLENLVTVCTACHPRVECGKTTAAPPFDPRAWGETADAGEWRSYEAAKRAPR